MISIYKEKAFDKIYYLLMIILNKRDIQGMHLNIKVIYNKRTANVIPKDKRLNPFPLTSGRRQGCPFSSVLLSIVLEVLLE